MKADLSRNTYRPWRHFRRVLDQQGRVVIDANGNEQTAIDLATAEQTAYDVIGPSGVPETSVTSTYDGGFQIGIAAGGVDLTISHGRIYADGLLIESDDDTTLTTQPFLPLSAGRLGPAGVIAAGVYAVYLDAWERVVTGLDDSRILELALGGPDTALRSQIAWQVRLAAVDTSKIGPNPSCAQIPPPWGTNPNQGALTAQVGATTNDPLPCVLPPQSGYQSLENQLYRVEIHSPGGYGAATFKWSRENGSVIAGISVPSGGSGSGATFKLTSSGRDSTLNFNPNDWVEAIDDDTEFQNVAGRLLQVAAPLLDSKITLSAAPAFNIDQSKHPKIRRWDQQQGATATGIPIVNGNWIALENGVEVKFSDGQFKTGDYWLIPARTATSADNVGTIEWRTDPATNAPLPEGPLGVHHYYAKLAIVAFDGQKFSAPQGAGAVTDCRTFFPPLTSIQTQSNPCTLVITDPTNWVGEINALFGGQPKLDAEICFGTGTFTTAQPVVIASTGNVKISGAGWGTRLVGQGIEAVLQFQGCASAVVRDLFASASSVDAPPDAATKASRVIHGALDFSGCGEVLVENVSLSCGAALAPGAACLVVRSDPTTNVTTGTGIARVRGCTLAVGEKQYGILLVHQQRAFVEENRIDVLATSAIKWSVKMASPAFQQQIVRSLLGMPSLVASGKAASSSSASSSSSVAVRRAEVLRVSSPSATSASSVGGQTPVEDLLTLAPKLAPINLNSGVTVGKQAIRFQSPPQVGSVFQTYADLNGPKEFANQNDLYAYVQKSALTLITNPAALAQYPSLQNYLNGLARNDSAVGARAIAVGGRAITELRVRDNSIANMLSGIVVGVSHREKSPPALPADSMQRIVIEGNTIALAQPAVVGAMPRFAIFVGNAANVTIEDNTASLQPPARTPTDGIRIFGYLGKKAIVRHNHTSGFTRDIFVRALLSSGPKAKTRYWYTTAPKIGSPNVNLWLVADNVAEGRSIDAQACIVTDNWP